MGFCTPNLYFSNTFFKNPSTNKNLAHRVQCFLIIYPLHIITIRDKMASSRSENDFVVLSQNKMLGPSNFGKAWKTRRVSLAERAAGLFWSFPGVFQDVSGLAWYPAGNTGTTHKVLCAGKQSESVCQMLFLGKLCLCVQWLKHLKKHLTDQRVQKTAKLFFSQRVTISDKK